MVVDLNINSVPSILKECFLMYSFKIGNYIETIDGQKQYNFNYTENSSLYNFANFIKENKGHYLNIDWLFDYFNYQFCYWNFIKEEKEKSGGLYLIQLHWILGKKALKRFDSRTSKDSYFYHSSFFPKFKIKKEDLIKHLEQKECLTIKYDIEEEDKSELLNQLNRKEEEIKKRYYNKLEGFNLCINFTTLFRFDSELCNKCKFKKNCKKILQINYPKVFQKRIAQKFIRNRIEKEKKDEGKN